MKKQSILFAALFVLVSGQAFGFDLSNTSSAQVYFSIPFGGTTQAEAMPRLGFSASVGRDFVGYTGHDDDFGIYSAMLASASLSALRDSTDALRSARGFDGGLESG